MRILIALMGMALPALTAASTGATTYSVAGSIAGPDGSWDYAKVDPNTHRLYVARSGSVTVAELGGGGNVTSWGDIARGHAVVPLPGNRLLVTSGNDGTVRFFDTTNGTQLASIGVGKKPDAAIYDAPRHRAFVMNADSGTVSVIDTQAMRVKATIMAKPALEYAVLRKGRTLFVNDEDANEIEVIDVVKGRTIGAVALPGCEGPTGLGYDARHDRLISACANGKAAVVDARTRKLIGLIDTGRGADAVIIDEVRRLAFIPCGRDGVLDILSLDAAAVVTKVGSVTTEVGARTGALDPSSGMIYLPTAHFGPRPPNGERPALMPGSFHVVIVRPS
jgi:YVTN family beta-propeller protein